MYLSSKNSSPRQASCCLWGSFYPPRAFPPDGRAIAALSGSMQAHIIAKKPSEVKKPRLQDLARDPLHLDIHDALCYNLPMMQCVISVNLHDSE